MNDAELAHLLAVTQERSRLLQNELAETNRGLIALELEYSEQFQSLYDELAKTNSELMQLNLELEDRVAQRVAELRKAEERYRDIFENAVEGIFQYTPAGRFMTANPALAHMLGYENPEALTNSIQDFERQLFVRPERSLEFKQMLESHGIARDFETRFFCRDQRVIWVSLNVRVMPGENREGFYYEGTAEDVTARREAEQELHKLNAELERRVVERTAQLEEMNRELEAFSYSVSHDLRAPLRAIDGFSRMLLRDYAPLLPEQGQKRLQVVRDNAQQMGQLIDDLLAFSRLGRQPLQKQAVSLASLVRSVFDTLSGEVGDRQVEFTISDLPDCQADPALLKQVFVNLLSNALKFTRPREVAQIEVGTSYLDDSPVYFVRDNGVGFDMQYVDKLFGVFQRLHRSDEFEGTGVGLATVQRVIHRHGGRVWAKSQVDQGTTFFFTVGEGSADE